MKKTVKKLMVALFVLGAMVMWISCQSPAGKGEDYKEVEIADIKLAKGTYEFEAVFSLGKSHDMDSFDIDKGTYEIAGTNPDSKVIRKLISSELVWKTTDNAVWADIAEFDNDALCALTGESGTFVKDNAKKTLTLSEEINEEDFTEEGTYSSLIIDAFKGFTIKQNASGTKTILEKTEEKHKEIITITRK